MSGQSALAVRPAMAVITVIARMRAHREALALTLRGLGKFSVAAAAGSAEDALVQVHAQPGIVFILDLPPSVVVSETRTILQEAISAKVLILTTADNEDHLIACAKAGAAGILTAETGVDGIAEAIENVSAGLGACSPEATAVLLQRVAATDADQINRGLLSRRETQIIALVDLGLSNKEIASRLCIEVTTVKKHMHNILRKVGARRRSEAAARMRAAGASVLPSITPLHLIDGQD